MKILLADAAEAVAPTNPILPDFGEMFWGALSFGVLYLLIKYVLLPPLSNVMEQRSNLIKSDLDAAEIARKEKDSLSLKLDDQLADVKTEAAAIIDQARSEAAAERSQVISKAEREVAAMKDKVKSDISAERMQALKSLRPEVVKVSVNAACIVLDRNIDPASAKPVLEEKLGNLS